VKLSRILLPSAIALAAAAFVPAVATAERAAWCGGPGGTPTCGTNDDARWMGSSADNAPRTNVAGVHASVRLAGKQVRPGVWEFTLRRAPRGAARCYRVMVRGEAILEVDGDRGAEGPPYNLLIDLHRASHDAHPAAVGRLNPTRQRKTWSRVMRLCSTRPFVATQRVKFKSLPVLALAQDRATVPRAIGVSMTARVSYWVVGSRAGAIHREFWSPNARPYPVKWAGSAAATPTPSPAPPVETPVPAPTPRPAPPPPVFVAPPGAPSPSPPPPPPITQPPTSSPVWFGTPLFSAGRCSSQIELGQRTVFGITEHSDTGARSISCSAPDSPSLVRVIGPLEFWPLWVDRAAWNADPDLGVLRPRDAAFDVGFFDDHWVCSASPDTELVAWLPGARPSLTEALTQNRSVEMDLGCVAPAALATLSSAFVHVSRPSFYGALSNPAARTSAHPSLRAYLDEVAPFDRFLNYFLD